jgi:anti-sigma B factor antagonist
MAERPTVPPPVISVSTERIGAIVIAHLFGEFDLAAADHVQRAVAAAAGASACLVLDLDGLRFLGSAGLKFLLVWAARPGLRVVAGRRQVLRPIQLAGLHTVLPVDSSVDEALAALRRPPDR